MSYKIYLKNPSQLKFVCGLAIPNGYCRVLDMTFDNKQQFENLKRAKGLAEVVIEETTLSPGAYTSAGQAVDYTSLHDWCFGEGEIRTLDEPYAVSEPEEDPLEDLKAQLDAKGIKYRANASEKALRGLLEAA